MISSAQNNLYSTMLFVAALVSAATFWITWRRRSVPSAFPVAVFMLAMTWWGATYAIHWTGEFRPTPFFWLDATYLGVVTVPTAFLAFVLQYTDRGGWLTRRNILILAIEPVITLVLLWTDPLHGLFFAGKRTATSGTILDGGPWFWTNAIYSYSLILIAFVLLIRARFRVSRTYRNQARSILLAALIPWISNAVSLAGLSPLPELDLTPLAFTLSGIILAFSLLYYRFLDIVPIARDRMIEEMSTGVIVLDVQKRVVDINPAALGMIGYLDPFPPIGRPVYEVLAAWPEFLTRYRDVSDIHEEVHISGLSDRYLDLTISPLTDKRGNFNGRLITLQDTTNRRNAELEVQLANERLQTQLAKIESLQAELREQAIRDPLTGLFNRRYLEETLERELSKAARDNAFVSVAMLDIDHFKSFNDLYGHKAGDLMLSLLGDLLKENTRGGDVVCRYGGEEFLIVLPGAPVSLAITRIEQWRNAFSELRVPYQGDSLHSTLSAGIAAFPIHGLTGDDVIYAADRALYAAKQAGRNRVLVWTSDMAAESRPGK